MNQAFDSAASVIGELAPIFARLDQLIAAATVGDEPPRAASDPYRGLYISPDDVARLLATPAAAPMVDTPLPERSFMPESRLAALQLAFGLTAFDLDLLLIAIAPELDLRYERLFAYLQDDVTRRKPSVDLALNLLCRDAAEKLARRARLDAQAPLLRQGILRLAADAGQQNPPLLAQHLLADPQVVRWLFRQDGLDPRLLTFCAFDPPLPSAAGLDPVRVRELAASIDDANGLGRPLHLHFHGTSGIGKRETALHAAAAAQVPVLIVELPMALAAGIDVAGLLPALFREAQLQGALLYFDGIDAISEPAFATVREALFERASGFPGVVIVAGSSPHLAASRVSLQWSPFAFAMPDFGLRRKAWQTLSEGGSATLDHAELDRLAANFHLTPRRIQEAVHRARGRAALSSRQPPNASELMAAVREQSGRELSLLARKVEAEHGWDDLRLPSETMRELKELCEQARFQHRVMNEWAFGGKLGRGRGISALFSGSSGTGKTMSAGVIARELGLDLYRIDLSQVVNKYIGETEKNLDRVFTAAESANAILFFDEADALFGKRSEVKDAHDRYANLEVSYLLQKMEEYEGLAILATNLRQNLDEAFLRRLSFIVEFPFPDETQRSAIWKVLFPSATPLADDVDFEALAHEVRLTGGHLRNIALAAAYLAASDGEAVHQRHLIQAARREHQKLGRSWTPPKPSGSP